MEWNYSLKNKQQNKNTRLEQKTRTLNFAWFFSSSLLEEIVFGPGEMAWWLRQLIDLPRDLGSVFSTCVRWLATTSNYRSVWSDASSGLHRNETKLQTKNLFRNTHTQIHRKYRFSLQCYFCSFYSKYFYWKI